MSTYFAFNIYPEGHFFAVPERRRYHIGKFLIDSFLQRNLLSGDEYSILLYDFDRVKIEIETERELAEELLTEVLETDERNGVITCWRSATPDPNPLDLGLKLLATTLRETLPERDPFSLSFDRWAALIRALNERNWDELFGTELDVTLRVWQIRIDTFFPEGMPNERRDQFMHFILNPLGDVAETEIRRRAAAVS